MQREEQADIDNVSHGALSREVVRSRRKKKVARTALEETVDNKIRRNAQKLSTANREKDVYRLEGGVTGDAAIAIAKAAYEQKSQAESERLRKLAETGEKAKQTVQGAAQTWNATRRWKLGRREAGRAVATDAQTAARSLLPGGEEEAGDELEPDSVSDNVITPALVKGREARGRAEDEVRRASRQQGAQVPGRGHGSVAPQPPPGAEDAGAGAETEMGTPTARPRTFSHRIREETRRATGRLRDHVLGMWHLEQTWLLGIFCRRAVTTGQTTRIHPHQ